MIQKIPNQNPNQTNKTNPPKNLNPIPILKQKHQTIMKLIIILIIYLTGVIISENMLLKLGIDKSEHKHKWLSWILVLTLLFRST